MKPVLQMQNVSKHFSVKSGILKAIDEIDLEIFEGETLGLVGESGCGKSTLGKMIMRLEKPSNGTILYKNQNILDLKDSKLREHRKEVQMIFQDPYASLNPRMTVRDILLEPIDIHRLFSGKQRDERICNLLELVGLDEGIKYRFPHELSGGQRQRVGIARALALNPKLLVCDEPISALDVSVQAQIINLLKNLQKTTGLTYLFIAHDLSVVKYVSSRVAVMYLGKIVEIANAQELYLTPSHPYTKALLSAVAIPDPKLERSREKTIISGEIPSPTNPPKGCVFATRCPFVSSKCLEKRPVLKEIAPGHFSACHLNETF